MLHFLLTKVKDVNALCNKKETLLASACKMGQLDTVNLLLENWADANISDDDGQTPLHWVCSEDEGEIVERLLQEDTLNINAVDKKENLTPLNSAVMNGHANNVSLLL
jgi:ankyrin repeat protein